MQHVDSNDNIELICFQFFFVRYVENDRAKVLTSTLHRYLKVSALMCILLKKIEKKKKNHKIGNKTIICIISPSFDD